MYIKCKDKCLWCLSQKKNMITLYIILPLYCLYSIQRCTRGTFSSLPLFEDVSQYLIIVIIVILTILPGGEAFTFLLHISFPHKLEVRGLHHPYFAPGPDQGPERLYYFWLVPLKETGAEYAEADLFALLEDRCQLVGTRDAWAGWYVPRDVILHRWIRQHLKWQQSVEDTFK